MENAGEGDVSEVAVIRGYAERLSKAARSRCGYWTVPVRNKAHHKPAYYLVFLTRHQEGLRVFGEAVSLGLQEWREFVYHEDAQGTLFEDKELFRVNEDSLAAEWASEIKGNLRRLLDEGRSFVIGDRYLEVYGSALGQAREKHLRQAWKELYAEGATKTDSKGKLLQKRIEPA